MRCRSLTILVCLAVATVGPGFTQVDPEYIYVSNVSNILRYSTESGTLEVIFTDPDLRIEGLNYGPDGLLYFCAPLDGIVARIDPEAVAPVAEIFYNALADPGPAQPECGWFMYDRRFLVSDQAAGGGIWSFDPLTLEPSEITPIAAALDGPTQYIDGNILVVEPGIAGKGNQPGTNGTLYSLEFPAFVFDPSKKISMAAYRGGVAVAQGYIFVTAGSDLRRYAYNAGGNLVFKGICASFGKNLANLLVADRNGSLFVATQSNSKGKLYQVEFDGSTCGAPSELASTKKPDQQPILTGVAVTPTSKVVDLPQFSGTGVFEFNSSHTWALSAGSDCVATIEAKQVLLSEIEARIANAGSDGEPVVFLGDNGFPNLWDLQGLREDEFDGCTESDCTCPPQLDGFYRHLLSFYSVAIPRPGLIACVVGELPLPPLSVCSPLNVAEGEAITVNIPFDPDLAPQDPVGGRRRSGSDHLLVAREPEFDPAGPDPFCGFSAPLIDTDEDDPSTSYEGPITEVNAGSSLTIKFRLGADGDPLNCDNGPYDTDAEALLSVNRVSPFKVITVVPSGAGSLEPALFDKPVNPTNQYHYNLDTTGFEPGELYLISVGFDSGESRVQQTLFRTAN